MTLVEKAEAFARKCHEGQKRKLTGGPYIVHPLEVAEILKTMTDDENLIAAGLLHDVIEDCKVDPVYIEKEFGMRVSNLVQAESEDRTSTKSDEETWMDRKEESLLFLQITKDKSIKMLWLADKLSNIRSFYENYQKMGDEMWSHFHQHDPKMHYWYYSSIANMLSDLKEYDAYKEYCELVDKTFGGIING